METNEGNKPTNEEDINPDDGPIDFDAIEKDARPAPPYVQGPVPIEKHYDAFKKVEERIRAQLRELPDKFYLTALRVAYDVEPSSSEPAALTHSFEFGPLEVVDFVLRRSDLEKIDEEELQKRLPNAPVSVTLLDEVYDTARGRLEEAALQKLDVGIYFVLHGSDPQPQIFARDCKCQDTQGNIYSGQHKRIVRTAAKKKLVTCEEGC